MNPSVAFYVGSDPVSVACSRKVSDLDSDQFRRGSEASYGSIPLERTGLARTGSGMAGSLKGGLASLLSAPSPSGASLSQLHRASYSSEQSLVSANFLPDYSSLDSSLNSRSHQALSALSATPKSFDKSPNKWALSASRTAMGHAVVGGVFSPLHSALVHLSSSQPLHAGSLPPRTRDRPSLLAQSSRSSQVSSSPLANFSSSLVEAPKHADGGPSLQARPHKPADHHTPFQRSVGFSLPRNSRSDNVLLATIPSANTLPEEAEGPLPRSQGGLGSGTDIEGAFLTPVTSFNNLPDKDDSPRLSVHDPHHALFRWEASIVAGRKAHGGERMGNLSTVSRATTSFPSLGSAALGSHGDVASKQRSGLADDREQVLRFVESASGLRQPSVADLLVEAQREHPIFSHQLVKRAFEFAASAHQGQVRKNGEPYVAHCLETAKILARIGADSTVVAAGLLHDCLDDTPMTVEQLDAVFGPSIAGLVKGVSNLSSISQRMRDLEGALSSAEAERLAHNGQALSETQLDLLRTMILSLEDVRVVLVKLADRIHNLRTLSGLSEEKRRRVASETLEVFAPLANRLGIWSWKAEIEDVCFRTLWPEEYRELQLAVEGSHGDESVLRSIAKLDSELRRCGVEFADLHGRSKNLYSIFNKMKSKGKTLSQVFDRRGIRLIAPDERSCYEALAVVRRVWAKEKVNHFKDYIQSPKGNGYQSLHVVLEDEDGHPLEIQIRTEAMHQAAEYGVAAHWRYKEKRKGIQCSTSRKDPGAAFGAEGDEEESPEDEQFAMQRVEWARYLVSWVAELTDVKVRLAGAAEGCSHAGSPAGSPRCAGHGSCGSAALGAREMCRFPEHSESCCFNPKMAFAAGAPRPPVPESEPVLVLLVQSDTVAVKKFQGSRSREDFVRDYLAERGLPHLYSQASLLVNSEIVPLSRARFHMGDTVEVILDAPPSPGAGGSVSPAGSASASEEELLFDTEALGGSALAEDALEGDLLPGFAREEGCPLAREFQRHRLAAQLCAGEGRAMEQNRVS